MCSYYLLMFVQDSLVAIAGVTIAAKHVFLKHRVVYKLKEVSRSSQKKYRTWTYGG